MLIQKSQNIPKMVENLRQQHQFQTLIQDKELDKNVKKVSLIIFCTSNNNNKFNANKKIVNMNN